MTAGEPWTFFGAPAAPDLAALDARVAFLGVPYDAGTPQPGLPTGQRAGPAAIRAASREIVVPGEGWYDLDAGRERLAGVAMADVGDVAIQGADTTANHDGIAAAARTVAARGALPSRSGATTRSASRSAAASRRSARSTSSTSTPTPTSSTSSTARG